MDKIISEKIEALLCRKHELYLELSTVLEAEQKAITEMAVDFLWKAASMKKKLGMEIEKSRISVLAQLEKIGIDHGMVPENFSVSALLHHLTLEPKKRAELEKIEISLNSIKEDVHRLARNNYRYVQEYLSVIDGMMTTITGAAGQKQYGASGSISSRSGYASSLSRPLIHAAV